MANHGYLNKDISFGNIIYFEPKNIQYKKLVNGVIDQLKVLLIDGDGNEILSNFKISIVLHIVILYIMEVAYKLNPQRSYRKGLPSKAYVSISLRRTTPLLLDLMNY